jgi:hypothetical protein
MAFFYAGGLSTTGQAAWTGFQTFNPLSPQLIMKSFSTGSTTFTRIDTLALGVTSGTVSEGRVVIVRNCLR